jgi:hypothetical protein
MAIFDLDPCGDIYGTSQVADFWPVFSGLAVSTSPPAGRGGQALAFTNETSYATKIFATSKGTVVFGTAYYTQTWGPLNTQILSFYDESTEQMAIWINASTGKLEVRKNGVLVETSTFTVPLNTWFYVEFKVVFSNTGSYELRINGNPTPAANNGGSAYDTTATANNYADRVTIHGKQGGASYMDDAYLDDSTFQGDCRIEALFPSSTGNSTQLTPNGAGSNWQCVDEAPPNDDTDYVSSNNPGDKDTYGFGNLATASGTILAVKVYVRAKKDSAGSRAIKTVARSGTTEVDGAANYLSSSYQYYSDLSTTKPGGGPWTISDVNAAEFGVKVFA